MPLEADVLAAFPAEVQIPARPVASALAASVEASPRVLVVLDDDPTGTQSVADLPVLTRWDVADFTWAFGTVRASAGRLRADQHPQPGPGRGRCPQRGNRPQRPRCRACGRN